MLLFTHPEHLLDLLLLPDLGLFGLGGVEVLDGLPAHGGLLFGLLAVDGSALHDEGAAHGDDLFVLLLLEADLFVEFVVGVVEGLLDVVDHLAVVLPVLEVEGVAVAQLLYLLLLVGLLELLVALCGLAGGAEEHLLLLLVHLQGVLAGGLVVEHLVPLVLPHQHILLLLEFAQGSDEGGPCVGEGGGEGSGEGSGVVGGVEGSVKVVAAHVK